MHESLIMALRFCASGEKFPRMCTESCPLYCANGNADTCTACIDSMLRQAAEALENRVLTLEEVKTHCEGGVEAAPLWVEFDEGLSRWVQIAPHEPGCELEYVSVFVSIMWPQYGKGWRCWLRKPTEEETAGTPWNEKGGTEK